MDHDFLLPQEYEVPDQALIVSVRQMEDKAFAIYTMQCDQNEAESRAHVLPDEFVLVSCWTDMTAKMVRQLRLDLDEEIRGTSIEAVVEYLRKSIGYCVTEVKGEDNESDRDDPDDGDMFV